MMRISRVRMTCLLLGSSVALAACTPMKSTHGNYVEGFRMENIQPGVSTQSDVIREMGSPTTISPFDESTWYYIGQKMKKKGIFDAEVSEEEVFIAKFDEMGTLVSLTERESGRVDVPVAQKETPTYGTERTLLQEFLGNLGKFNDPSSGIPGVNQ